MVQAQIELPMDAIAEFCRRWQIVELALFGSVLRDDFRPDSDIDVLVKFAPDHGWGFFALAEMQHELSDILGRDVDLVSKRGIEMSHNELRRGEILGSAEVVYAA